MKVIVIGSGIAGVTFAEKLRALSPDAKITLLTKENHGYYSRPRLSLGFSHDDIEQSIVIKSFDELRNNNICVISGVEVTGIDRQQQQVSVKGIDEIETLEYDKLVLATGSAAFIPPPFLADRDNYFLFNSLTDLKILRQFRQGILQNNSRPNWAIIGGGLIGCELASDLALAQDQVSLFHVMDRLMERQLVEEDSATLLDVLQNSGVDVRLNQVVKGFEKNNDKMWVVTEDSKTVYDGIIVACGFKPRTELAAQAGLKVGRGIKTDQLLQTNDENIYALGDVAELPNGKLYAFIMPIRNQAVWLASYLCKHEQTAWAPPEFKASAKVNNFVAAHPYLF